MEVFQERPDLREIQQYVSDDHIFGYLDGFSWSKLDFFNFLIQESPVSDILDFVRQLCRLVAQATFKESSERVLVVIVFMLMLMVLLVFFSHIEVWLILALFGLKLDKIKRLY
jgi:hypothetical protein